MTPVKLEGTKVWPDRYEVVGHTDTYIVARKKDATWGCSCPRWKFHKAPKIDCKHIKALFEAMARVTTRKIRDANGRPVFGTVTPLSESVVPEIKADWNDTVTVEGETFRVGRKIRPYVAE